MTKEERDLYTVGVFSDSERQDVEEVIKVLPLIEVKIEHFVEGEKEIAVGDILTLRITITQLNVKEGEQTGYVHSNQFPFLK